MAILIEEKFDGRKAGENSKFEHVYARVFEATTSSRFIGPKAVRAHSDVPQMGQTYNNAHPSTGVTSMHADYEADAGAFVNDISVDSVSDDGTYWQVTVGYGPANTDEQSGDPTEWKIRVRFGGERTERVVLFDRFGNPIMNSAGDRFGDPLTVDSHISTMLITRNELVSTFDLSLASDYSDTVNSATWNGFPAKTCKMGIIETSDEQYDTLTQRWYYAVTYPIKINRDTWTKQLLDQGFNELDPYDNSKPILSRDGQPVADPRPLDGSGHELDGTDGYSSPTILPFEVEDAVDWSGLGLNLALRLGV